jgi:hypothetical protein
VTQGHARVLARVERRPFDALDIAVEAYTYAYPLILMDTMGGMATSVSRPDCENGAGAPLNQFSHLRQLADAASLDVVQPSLDTLYSSLWFDVSHEPLVISVPDSEDRYYSLSLLDYWSDVFASPGARTTGTEAQLFAVVGPAWGGKLPRGIRTYRSPTAYGWLIGLTHLRGADDIGKVARFQAALSATPWSSWGQLTWPASAARERVVPDVSPRDAVARMSASEFFSRFCELTRHNAPHARDYALVDRLERIGIRPGHRLDVTTLSPEIRLALERAPSIARQGFEAAYERSCTSLDGWRTLGKPRGTYGTEYSVRAAVAHAGLGAIPNEDALAYVTNEDGAGDLLDSERRYTLTFPPGMLPPAHAFWSLTLYDNLGRFAHNPLGRYTLGSASEPSTARDGAVSFYIQRDTPGASRERNWLPAPRSGSFSLSLRLYWPAPAVLDGEWSPPALERVDEVRAGSSSWLVQRDLQ